MVEVKSTDKINKGDKVWWFDQYGTLRWGIVFNIMNIAGMEYASIHEEGKAISTGTFTYNCWHTEEACLEAETKRQKEQVAQYKESITDIEQLVGFMYSNMTRCEYADYEALEAVRDRAKDLLGLELSA